MLLECDFRGRVLWMSDHTRIALRDPEYLSDAFILPNPAPSAARTARISPLLLWVVWESPVSVLIGAKAVEAEPGETKELLRIQTRLSLHFLHLLRLERRLFVREWDCFCFGTAIWSQKVSATVPITGECR